MPVGASGRAPDRERQQDDDGEGHDEPGRVGVADQGRQAEGRDDSRGRHPVIAGDELPHAHGSIANARHALTASGPAMRDRDSRANRSEKTRTPGTTISSAASPPGHSEPAPSAPQKIPNEVSITPTLNFIAFSGTLASGRRTATPTAATTRTAAAAASAARPRRCWFAPKVRAMKTTSSPSSRTPLKAMVNE